MPRALFVSRLLPATVELTLGEMKTGAEVELPNPTHLLEEFEAYHRSLALRTALELNLFTHIGSGAATPQDLAVECNASERGIRILCDYLTVIGHLTKQVGAYRLTLNSRLYLSTASPAYLGSAIDFLAGEAVFRCFESFDRGRQERRSRRSQRRADRDSRMDYLRRVDGALGGACCRIRRRFAGAGER